MCMSKRERERDRRVFEMVVHRWKSTKKHNVDVNIHPR